MKKEQLEDLKNDSEDNADASFSDNFIKIFVSLEQDDLRWSDLISDNWNENFADYMHKLEESIKNYDKNQ
jgi:hypothetical protein